MVVFFRIYTTNIAYYVEKVIFYRKFAVKFKEIAFQAKSE